MPYCNGCRFLAKKDIVPGNTSRFLAKNIWFLAIPAASWPKKYRSWKYLPFPGYMYHPWHYPAIVWLNVSFLALPILATISLTMPIPRQYWQKWCQNRIFLALVYLAVCSTCAANTCYLWRTDLQFTHSLFREMHNVPSEL